MKKSTRFLIYLVLGLVIALTGCNPNTSSTSEDNGGEEKKPRLAYITNGVADFWVIAKAGVEQAAAELGIDATVIMPNGMTDQTRKIEDLLTRGTDGIAISPIDPDNQVEIINTAAAKTNVLTHDSDAPQTDRLLYIGMDNYNAGLICGKLVRKAIPDGGKVMIFVGRVEQDNARRRRQGTIDGILGREPDSTRNDPAGEEIRSEDGKFIILGTMTDQFDRAKAKANAEDVLTRHPDIAAMVGLFEYNPPLIMEALDRAGKLGKVKVVAFDENEQVLQGIKDGVVTGTVVQNPFMYGYESMRVLKELHEGNKDIIPENAFLDIPARVIFADETTKEFAGAEVVGVDAFRNDLNAKLGR